MMDPVVGNFDYQNQDKNYIGSNGMTPSPASDNASDASSGKKWYRKVAHR